MKRMYMHTATVHHPWRFVWCFVGLVFITFFAFSGVQAKDLYRWVDREGNIHITETPPEPTLRGSEVKSIHIQEQMTSEKEPVAVYGRDACGLTRRMISALRRAGVPFIYEVVDDERVHQKVKMLLKASGIDTAKGYNLPVVEVNGRILIRPEPQNVVNMYTFSR